MEDRYDYEGLREEIRKYLETEAIMNPIALADLSFVKNANKEELVELALRLPINADHYKIEQ